MFSWRTAVGERTCDLDMRQVDNNLTFSSGDEKFGSVVPGMLWKFGVSGGVSRIIDWGTELLNKNFQALRSSYVSIPSAHDFLNPSRITTVGASPLLHSKDGNLWN